MRKKIIWGISLLFVLLFINLIFKVIRGQENPDERNYISFRHDSKDNVLDSIISLRNMLQSYSFPGNGERNEVIIYTLDGELTINKTIIGKFNFNNIRKHEIFKHLSDAQIVHFMTLFKYLYNNDLNQVRYKIKNNSLDFDYKDIYELGGNSPDGGYLRILVFDEHFPSGFYLLNGKLLDSYKSLYLLADSTYEIRRDNVPYKRNNE